MTRVLARFCLVLAAMIMAFGVAPQIAAAQDVGDLQVGDAAAEGDEADADADSDGHDDIVGEGFTVGRGIHFVIPDAQPGEGGTGGGDAGAGLAHTGVETEAGVAIAGGLFAVGASAIVASRRRVDHKG